jgi:outer membrane protein, heavy metal efflux system
LVTNNVLAALCAALAISTAVPATAELQGSLPQQLLTADALAEWVLEANAGLAAARSAAEAAAHRIDSAAALDDPALSYGVAPLTASADRSINQRVELSQKFPWPGTLAAREAAARFDAEAADADVGAYRLHVVAAAKQAFAEWRYIADALRVYHDTQDVLDDLIIVTGTRYAAGRALKQDALQAELERTRLENHKLQLLRQQTQVLAIINAMLNRSPDEALPAAAPIVLQANPPPLVELRDTALALHPELMRLDAQVAANESRVTLAEKAFRPDFQLGVGYNSLWNEVDKRPVLGLSINIPLYRGKRHAELDRAKAETRRANHTLADRRATLLAGLASARARVVESRASVALYEEKLVPLAAEFLSATVSDYRSGAGGFVNVIVAEQQKLETELAYARTLADYARHQAELERWTGAPTHLLPLLAAGVTP